MLLVLVMSVSRPFIYTQGTTTSGTIDGTLSGKVGGLLVVAIVFDYSVERVAIMHYLGAMSSI
jgi:hypothetical protein